MLAELRDHKNASVLGIEIDHQHMASALQKGLSVIQMDINQDLHLFQDHQFDVAIIKQTLQVLTNPLHVLQESLRIAKECLIVFPNFAQWRNRIRISLVGRMPISDALPYEWYDTPNIHLMSVVDFKEMCQQHGIEICQSLYRGESTFDRMLIRLGFVNLGSSLVLARLRR